MLEELSPIQQINALLKISDSLRTSYPNQSLDFAEQALQMSEELKYEKGQLQAMISVADIYWEKTDLKTALNFADQAKALAIKLNDQKEYAEAIIVISKVYTELGEYDRSSDLNFQALKIFEEENNKMWIGNALNRIGYVYFEQENYDKALDYYSRSLTIAREINDMIGIARGLNNIAAVYGSKGEIGKLKANLYEAAAINKKTGKLLWEGTNYLNLGTVNREEKNNDSSLYYYRKAEIIFTELNNLPKLTAIYTSLSYYYTLLNQVDSSLIYAELALEIGKKNNLKKTIYNAAIRLHYIYLGLNDIEEAYKYSSLQYQMKDSLDIEKGSSRLSQMELLYDFEKLNQENKFKQQRRDYTYVIIATSLLFIFIVTIILLITRQRIRSKNTIIEKKQLENELEIRNKELTSNVMSLMKKNEILSEIADKLMEVRDDAVKVETKIAIKRIAKELQKTTDDEIWDEFEIRFRQVHSDFYEKLIQKFPNLSPNEQRLCAFLRLNMTTKEISELTGQRTGTLEIARSRLRKKLGITNTQVNLVNFLSQI